MVTVKNWKTTAFALIAAAAGFVLMSPELFAHFAWAVPLAKSVALGGFAAFGLTTKDATTTSTQGEVDQATLAATTARIASLKP